MPLTTLGFTFLTLLVAASPNWFQQMDEAIYHIKWQLNAPLLTAVNLLAKKQPQLDQCRYSSYY